MNLLHLLCWVLALPMLAASLYCLLLTAVIEQRTLGQFVRAFFTGLVNLAEHPYKLLAIPLAALALLGVLAAGFWEGSRLYAHMALVGLSAGSTVYVMSVGGAPKAAGEVPFFLPSLVSAVLSAYLAWKRM